MFDRPHPNFWALLLIVGSMLMSSMALAEGKVKAEDLVDDPAVSPDSEVDLGTLKRARMTEEQAINQLKFMMVKGWARVEKELLDRGSFRAFGMVLSPQGDFRPVYIDRQEVLPPDVQLATIVKNLEAIAQTRSMFAVGVMYIQAKERSDGTVDKRIMVLAEHIAGWARHWAYPFKIENGEVKLAAPKETPVEPVYFVQQK